MEVIYVRWPLRRPRNIDNAFRRIEVSMKRVRRHLTVFCWFRVLWQENNQGKAIEGIYEGRSRFLRRNVKVLVLRMNGRFRRCLWFLGQSLATVGHGRADWDSRFGHRMDILVLWRSGRFGRRYWFLGRSFTTVGRGRAD
ncbi:hypothetical protein FF1_041830 [Malus domestica]